MNTTDPYLIKQKADNLMNSNTNILFDLFLCRSSQRNEHIGELYERAGSLYLTKKNYDLAIESFCNAIKIYETMSHFEKETITCYEKLFKCYKNGNLDKAIECMVIITDYYRNNNNYTELIKNYLHIGDLFAKQDFGKAIEYYEKAKKYAQLNNKISYLIEIYERIYKLLMDNKEYKGVLLVFEEYLNLIKDDKLYRYRAFEILFKEILCKLYLNYNITDYLNDSINIFPMFSDTVDYEIIIGISNSIDNKNIDSFEKTLKNYNKIKKFDKQHCDVLNEIKKKILFVDLNEVIHDFR